MSEIQVTPYQSIKRAFDHVPITIIQNNEHEFLVPTESVALGYGVVRESVRSTKRCHSDELIEGTHWVRSSYLKENRNCVSKSHADFSTYPQQIYWTKQGVVRLGFFIKSEKAKQFRNWAENLILENKSVGAEFPYIYLSQLSRWYYRNIRLRVFTHDEALYFIGDEVIRCLGYMAFDIVVDKHKAWDYLKHFKVECARGKSFEHTPCISIEGVVFLINCLKPNKGVATFESWLVHYFVDESQKTVCSPEPQNAITTDSKALISFADELKNIHKVSFLFRYAPENTADREKYLDSITEVYSWFDEKLADLTARMNASERRV